MILYLLLFNGFTVSLAQQENKSDVSFLVKTIRSAYAGYRDKVEGRKFKQLVSHVKKNLATDTFAFLSKITLYFKDLHLILYDRNIGNKVDRDQCRQDSTAVVDYLDNPQLGKGHEEGYWISDLGNCIMGLQKVSSNPLVYKGFLVETKTKAPPGYCILTMTADDGGCFITDYREEGLAYRVFLRAKFRDSATLLVNSYGKWHKLASYQKGMLATSEPFTYKTELKTLDSNTILLKMPDFGAYNIKKVDSMVNANSAAFARSEHLIVDIRNNMGGSINNYMPLLPFLCDKDIVHPAASQLSSEELIRDMQEDLNYYRRKNNLIKVRAQQTMIEKMEANRNEFIYFDSDVFHCKPGRHRLKRVSVLVNNACLSAAELMLLDFRQSSIVKIFGENTGGAVDYLDALMLSLPSEKYVLLVATTKRVLTPEQGKFDDTGIMPDVWIPDTVSDWVQFVKDYYENR